MSQEEPKQRLLREAVEAHERYIEGVEQLKAARQEAFRRALAGPVTAREISDRVGLSGSIVSRISKGQR